MYDLTFDFSDKLTKSEAKVKSLKHYASICQQLGRDFELLLFHIYESVCIHTHTHTHTHVEDHMRTMP